MENKETFDAVAGEYEKYRPVYPQELFQDLIDYAGVNPSADILEIGCGTGQATSGLVERGFTRITCVELGGQLAKIASEKFQAYADVNVIHSSFEDWHGEERSYDLAISATAFHFIEPQYGYRKVSRLLRAGGAIGFFWTVHVPLYDQVHDEIRAIYQRYAPHLDDRQKAQPTEVIAERKRLTEQSGFFHDVTVKEYRSMATYSSDDYISLLNTHSKHQQLSEPIRNQLFHEMKQTIDERGGFIRKPQLVALFLGRLT